MFGDVRRVSEEFLKVYLSAVNGVDIYKVLVRLRMYLSVQAFYGAPNAQDRQKSTHLTLLKPQNTKIQALQKTLGLCTF